MDWRTAMAAAASVTTLMAPSLAAEAAAVLGDVVVQAITTEDASGGNWACNVTGVDHFACNDSQLFPDNSGNGSAAFNGSRVAEEPLSDVILMVATSVVLGLMILITVIGNVFVIAAILLERHLQSVANYLIVSLAVADLMVACLVMPLGAVYEISKGWILGPELCDMWTSSDVLCCTASILHLVAIAVDRYWAVTNIDYIHTRNSSRIGIMIVLVWGVALIVSLAPQFGWKDPGYLDRINLQQRCLVSQDVAYQIFATCSTFYVPLLVILVLYWKIFQTARKRIRHRVGKAPALNNCSTPPAKRKKKRKHDALERHSDVDDETRQNTTAFTITAPSSDINAPKSPAVTTAAASNNVSPDKSSTNNGSASHQRHISDTSNAEMLQQKDGSGKRNTPASTCTPVASSSSTGVATVEQERRDPLRERRDKKESMEAKRERKAAKTLAIITGAFVICWLPFFIMALLMPLCESCFINDYVASFFLWLGYFNSTLNPVIYTIFSPEFRQAFKRILCGSKSRSNYRPRKFR